MLNFTAAILKKWPPFFSATFLKGCPLKKCRGHVVGLIDTHQPYLAADSAKSSLPPTSKVYNATKLET